MKKLTALLVILSSWGVAARGAPIDEVLAQSQEKSVPQHYRYPDAITMTLGGSPRMFPKTSAPLSSVTVDSIHYDENMGQTFITVTNASNRDITAFALDLPPGMQMRLLIEEFLGGSGFFHPGETVDVSFGEEMKLESLPIPCAVVYSDVTAESTNSYALEHIKTYRESTAAAYERAVELAATTSDPEKLADELQAESDPPQQQHGMPPLIKKKKPETPDKPSPEAKTSERPMPDLVMLHSIAQNIVDGRSSIEDIREQAVRWRTHSKITLDTPR